MSKIYTLKKHERLKGQKRVQTLFQQGKSFVAFPVRVVYSIAENEVGLRAGFSVSKKKFNRANQRNRVKRLLREVWRLNNLPLKQKLITNEKSMSVFFIYTGARLPEFCELQTVMRQVINKLTEMLDGRES